MWTRQELKERGKAAFRAHYWPNVLVALLLVILTAGGAAATGSQRPQPTPDQTINLTDPQAIAAIIAGATLLLIVLAIVILVDIFLFNPLKVGCYAFFRDNVENGDADLNAIKTGFSDYGHKFGTMFLADLYNVLWCLLFIIPGFVKFYSYRMVPFILRDNPELSANEVITKSRKMMDGQKWNTFVLDLSFLGWDILACLTLGLVGVFWSNPYQYNTNAALYLKLLENEAQN